tara:strand:- start:1442 stop:2479 length:1038 start_codon:yes stop_codon:yes gene_type:complete
MKILMPFTDPYNHALTHPVVSGGTEMFCKGINDNFQTWVIQIPYESINYSVAEKRKLSREIINSAEQYGCDVIVSNFASAVFAGAEIITSHIPIMFIEHCVYPMPSCISRWNRGIDNGHSFFLVSKWQEKKYRKMAERTNQRPLKVSGYINPSYCKGEKRKLHAPYFDIGTIGRCDKNKNPFKLLNMIKDSDYEGLVITSQTQRKADIPYYNKNQHWKNICWDLPHEEVMDKIGHCRMYFSTWNAETWGITSMEALSVGIPTILNCDSDGDHASEIIPASKNHFRKIPNNDKESLLEAVKSFSKVDRKEIQDMTWEKHNVKSWTKTFANFVDLTVDNFNKKRAIL